MNYYLECDKCGHPNQVISEFTVYCGKCKTHLIHNYIDWVGTDGNKSFDSYKKEVCLPETDVEVPKPSPRTFTKNGVEKTDLKPKKKKRKLTKAQLVGIIVGAVSAAVFGQLGRNFASDLIEKIQFTRIEHMDFAEADTTNWEMCRFSEENFKMMFPKEPVESTQIIESEIGTLNLAHFNYEPELGENANILYGAGFTVYPAEYIDSEQMSKEQLAEFFKNSINGSLTTTGGELITTNSIDFKGYPGKEILFNVKEGLAIIKMRCYLVKNKMYISQVVSPAKNATNYSVDYFLDSFEIDL